MESASKSNGTKNRTEKSSKSKNRTEKSSESKEQVSLDAVPWEEMGLGEKTVSVLTHPVTVMVATFAAMGALIGAASRTKSSDVELCFRSDLGHDEVAFARNMYNQRIEGSWVHKNPILAGALTFGLAHVFGESRREIIQDVVLETRRNFPNLVERERAERDAAHQRFIAELPYHVQDRQSQGQEAIASTMGRAAVASIAAISNSRNRAS